MNLCVGYDKSLNILRIWIYNFLNPLMKKNKASLVILVVSWAFDRHFLHNCKQADEEGNGKVKVHVQISPAPQRWETHKEKEEVLERRSAWKKHGYQQLQQKEHHKTTLPKTQ